MKIRLKTQSQNAVLAQAELVAQATAVAQAWAEMQKFGTHDGDCTFSGRCPECGTPTGACSRHSSNMEVRTRAMSASVEQLKAFAGLLDTGLTITAADGPNLLDNLRFQIGVQLDNLQDLLVAANRLYADTEAGKPLDLAELQKLLQITVSVGHKLIGVKL